MRFERAASAVALSAPAKEGQLATPTKLLDISTRLSVRVTKALRPSAIRNTCDHARTSETEQLRGCCIVGVARNALGRSGSGAPVPIRDGQGCCAMLDGRVVAFWRVQGRMTRGHPTCG